jgi:AcrR family transcriptional regulator
MAPDDARAPSDKRSRTNTRARLLASARTVFTQQGYGATSVGDVCQHAGFTRGAFYSNFDSMDELFLALWDEEAARIVAAVGGLGDVVGDADDPLAATIEALGALEVIDPGWFVLNTEFLLHAVRNPAVAENLARHRQHLRDELGRLIGELLDTERRDLPAGIDIERLSRMVIAVYEGSQHQVLVEPGEHGAAGLQTAMLELLIEACPPRPLPPTAR